MTPERRVDDALAQCVPGRRVWVAFSGGLDSSLLLAVATPLARARGLSLAAIHVNHGLQAASAAFERHCREACARLAVPLVVEPVTVVPDGAGVEAAAREARYRAFRSHLAPGDSLLLAQHADDQAETFLLAALRGSGVRGLAAMPAVRETGGIVIRRPWLGLSRAALEGEAARRELAWVDDPTNVDDGFDRNYLRLRVLPALARRWPRVSESLQRSAAYQQEADALLTELATIDLHRVGGDPSRLPLTPLLALNAPRRRLLIRHALACQGVTPPPAARLDELLGQIERAGADRLPQVGWPGGEARVWRDTLYLMAPLAARDPVWTCAWDGVSPLETPWQRYPTTLVADSAPAASSVLRVTLRRGGERMRLAGRGTRDLKRLLNEAGLPPWERERVPLVWHGDTLIAVLGHLTAPGWTQARCTRTR